MELLPSALEGQDSNETQLDAVSHTSYVHDQIGFNNCSFSWEPFDAQPQKGRRNFKLTFGKDVIFQRGCINLILGPTASGKVTCAMNVFLFSLLMEVLYVDFGFDGTFEGDVLQPPWSRCLVQPSTRRWHCLCCTGILGLK